MTAKGELLVDRRRLLGRIDERVYGTLLEHVGQAIYGGVLDDTGAYQPDVLAACHELRPSVIRWPGGNFASGYHWQDGIGPTAARPSRHDLAWDAVETNAFGTEEFLRLCAELRSEPYINLNLSTGTFDEAVGWVEYCNGTAPIPEVLARDSAPHGVRLWGLGNENYGWWQHAHTSAERYAETAREVAKLVRWTDPAVELVVVGGPDPDWTWEVLRQTARLVDFISLHFYWRGNPQDPYQATLAGPIASEQDIIATHGMALAASRAQGCERPLRIAVDEWGVWTRTGIPLAEVGLNHFLRGGLNARSGIDTRFPERYDLKDALAVASWLHVLWRHPDKVGLANQAQLVNVLAPIYVENGVVVRQPVFWPLATARAHARSTALDVAVHTDAGLGSLPAVDAAGTTDGTTLHLSIVNRLLDEEVAVALSGVSGRARRITLSGEDPFSTQAVPVQDEVDLGGGLVLPPHSHSTLILEG